MPGEITIKKVTLHQAQRQLDSLTDTVVAHQTPILITRPDHRNVVLLSEDEFTSWQETAYLWASDANRQVLDQSLHQLATGQVKTFTTAQWQDLTK